MKPEEWGNLTKILAESDNVLIKTDIDLDELLNHFPKYFTNKADNNFHTKESGKIPIFIEDCFAKDEKMKMFRIKIRLKEVKKYTSNKWSNLGKALDLLYHE
jgi:hypothetical protein